MSDLIEGRWYWVRVGSDWFLAEREKEAAGGWRGDGDRWEDVLKEVVEWELIPLPKWERARLRQEYTRLQDEKRKQARELREERGARILDLRRNTNMTLAKIGEEIGISGSRTRQLLRRAEIRERRSRQ